MIRKATAADLDGVAAVYEAVLNREEQTGCHWTNWQSGVYPCRATAERALADGTLYVDEVNGHILGPTTPPFPQQSRQSPNRSWSSTPFASVPSARAAAGAAGSWPLPRAWPPVRAVGSSALTPMRAMPLPLPFIPNWATGWPDRRSSFSKALPGRT